MPHQAAKKARSNSGVQPSETSKRPHRRQPIGLLNLLDLLPTTKPPKTTGKKKTIIQASIAKRPTKELLKALSKPVFD